MTVKGRHRRQPKVVVVSDDVAVAVVNRTRTAGVCLSLNHCFVCDSHDDCTSVAVVLLMLLLLL